MDATEHVRRYFVKMTGMASIRDDDDVFAKGMVNSLAAMELVLYVEKQFGVTIENEELRLENFNTINAINSLIVQKQERFVGA